MSYETIFSGIGCTLLTLFITANKIKIVFNPFTVITNPKEEELFTNASLKMLRNIVIYSLFYFFSTVYFTLLTEIDFSKSNKPSNIIFNLIFDWWSFITIIAIGIIFITLIVSKYIKNIFFKSIHNVKNMKPIFGYLYIGFILFVIFLYFILVSLYYGIFINIFISIVCDSYDNITEKVTTKMFLDLPTPGKQRLFWITICLTGLYGLFLTPIIKFYKSISSSTLKATIVMNSGKVYRDKYILHTDLDGFLLIADEANKDYYTKQMIPKNGITEITFSTLFKTFGKEHRLPTSITLPEKFNDEEKYLLK